MFRNKFAELGDELTIRSGEIIKDVKRMSGGWWEGSLKGKRGLFPDNFVKVGHLLFKLFRHLRYTMTELTRIMCQEVVLERK